MPTATISIYSDNDFDVHSPIGYFPAYGPELEHTITAETETELRKEVVWFLASLDIRPPYAAAPRFALMSSGGHDTSFKMMVHEAMHRIATGDFGYHFGGNRELHVDFDFS